MKIHMQSYTDKHTEFKVKWFISYILSKMSYFYLILIWILIKKMKCFYKAFLLNKSMHKRSLYFHYILTLLRVTTQWDHLYCNSFLKITLISTFWYQTPQIESPNTVLCFSPLFLLPFLDSLSSYFVMWSIREPHLVWSLESLCIIPFLRGIRLDSVLVSEMPGSKMILRKHKQNLLVKRVKSSFFKE